VSSSAKLEHVAAREGTAAGGSLPPALARMTPEAGTCPEFACTAERTRAACTAAAAYSGFPRRLPARCSASPAAAVVRVSTVADRVTRAARGARGGAADGSGDVEIAPAGHPQPNGVFTAARSNWSHSASSCARADVGAGAEVVAGAANARAGNVAAIPARTAKATGA